MKKKSIGIIAGLIGVSVVGVNAVLGVLNYRKAKDLHKNYNVAVTFSEEAVDMSDKSRKVDCAAMFSSMTLDFRNCVVDDQPYEIELFAKFAGVEIIVPEEWYVEAKGRIAMAGVDNYTSTYEDSEPNVILHYNASFAGISIKNVRYS